MTWCTPTIWTVGSHPSTRLQSESRDILEPRLCRWTLSSSWLRNSSENAHRMIDRQIANEAPITQELDILAKDGSRLTLEVSSRLMFRARQTGWNPGDCPGYHGAKKNGRGSAGGE